MTPANSQQSKQFLELNSKEAIVTIPTGSFVLPTFCDLHMHAPQFLYQGTGLDLPLMKWLDTYALKARLDEDPELANRVYTVRLATRLKEMPPDLCCFSALSRRRLSGPTVHLQY
jgi:guanine deaminase